MGGFGFDPNNFYGEDQQDFTGFDPQMYGRGPSNGANNGVGYTDDEIKRLKELAARQNPSTDIYNAYSSAQPKREDYEPNVWGKIAATLVGMTSRDPYRRAKEF